MTQTGSSSRAAEAQTAGGRAADALVRELEAMIVAGELDDGAHLPPERELMGRFGTSRTVVREAIAGLARRGLVENRPRHRPVVRRPGYEAALAALGGVVGHLLVVPNGVRNLYDTRIFTEAALVRHAAIHARKPDVAALRDALAANEAAIPDSARFYATDVAFHRVFYEIPENPVFPAVHGAFTSWLAVHWERMPRSPERNRANFVAHRAILDAVLARDPDGAEAALREHLAAAWAAVRGTFDTPNV
jgi:DNA-binding FadR family transcriptional regulator